MLPRHVDTFVISMRLEFGWTASQVAAETGETLEMLVHLLSVHGCPDLSTRLSNAARLPTQETR